MDTAAPEIDQIVDWIAARLAQGSIQGALLVAFVWMVCRSVNVTPRLRAMLWWMVSLKLVLTFLPLPSVPLPLLPASPDVVVAAAAGDTTLEPETPALAAADAPSPQAGGSDLREATEPTDALTGAAHSLPSERSQIAASPVPWLPLIVVSWFAIIVVHAVRLVMAHRRVVRVVRRAIPVTAQEALEVEYLAQRIGLRRTPIVCASDEVASPQATGIRRPTIVLPHGFAERVGPGEWQMALCHELWHLRRRDLLLGWIPAIAARLFFFHPFALVAANQYLLAREAACDAAAVEALDVEAHDYARMLVRLGLSRTTSGVVASGAAPTASLLRRRLEMLHQVTTTAGASRAHWFVAVAAMTLIPFHLVAKSPAARNDGIKLASPVSAAPPSSGLDTNQTVSPGDQEQKAAPPQAPRPPEPTASSRKSGAADKAAPVEKTTSQAPTNEQIAHDFEVELNKHAADVAEQIQDAIRQALEHQQELAVHYQAMHPDMRAIDRQLAELHKLASNEALKGFSAGMAGMQEQLRFAMQALQNVPGGQDQAAREAQLKALSQQLEALSKQLETLRSGDQGAKDEKYKADLKALKGQLQALEAAQRQVTRAATRESTRGFLDAQIAAQRAQLEALKAQRQSAVTSPDRERLDAQLQAAQASLQALEAKRGEAERAGRITRETQEKVRAASQRADARSLQATIARERANVERQKQLLDSAQRRLADAEARLREQRLKQQNQQAPQSPQAPQAPQKPQNPRP